MSESICFHKKKSDTGPDLQVAEPFGLDTSDSYVKISIFFQFLTKIKLFLGEISKSIKSSIL